MLRADLHIHTVLSPCGDLEMSPLSILEAARKQKLDIIGITTILPANPKSSGTQLKLSVSLY